MNLSRRKPNASCRLFIKLAAIACFLLPVSHAQISAPEQNAAGPAPAMSQPADPSLVRHLLAEYIDRLKHKLLHSWRPPKDHAEANCVVSFTVARDGVVSNIQLSKSSGNQQIDDVALKTIESLSPAEPLPAEAPPTVTVDFAFECVPAEHTATGDLDLSARKKAAEDNPADPKIVYQYGRALRFAGQPQESIPLLTKSIELGHPGCEPMLELALAYKKLNQLAPAEDILKQAVKRNPHFAPAHRSLGDLLYEQKRWEEAESSYSELLKLEPTGPLAELAAVRIQLCQQGGEPVTEDGEAAE